MKKIKTEKMLPDNNGPARLPPSLQKLLTVTNADGTPRTTREAKPPTELLARLEAFLPQMAQANARLPHEAPQAQPDVIENLNTPRATPPTTAITAITATADVTADALSADDSAHAQVPVASSPVLSDARSDCSGHSGRQDDQVHDIASADVDNGDSQTVEMHLFVDDSLGSLVPSHQAANDSSADVPSESSLIREIPSSPSAAPSASP